MKLDNGYYRVLVELKLLPGHLKNIDSLSVFRKSIREYFVNAFNTEREQN